MRITSETGFLGYEVSNNTRQWGGGVGRKSWIDRVTFQSSLLHCSLCSLTQSLDASKV